VELSAATGKVLARWGDAQHGRGQLFEPTGVGSDAKGDIYVSDNGVHQIDKYSPTHAFLTSWGSVGSGAGPGQFHRIFGMAVDGSGNAYISDYDNNRVQEFSASGHFKAAWGPCAVRTTCGTGSGQLSGPDDVAVDVHGNVYALDYGNSRVVKYSPKGKPLLVVGPRLPSGYGSLLNPETLAVDGHGAIYVADRDHSRIVKLSATGHPLVAWKTKDAYRPYGVAVDTSGRIYVSEFIGSPIIFRPVMSSIVVTLSPKGNVLAVRK
jgi:streptogramin lyase